VKLKFEEALENKYVNEKGKSGNQLTIPPVKIWGGRLPRNDTEIKKGCSVLEEGLCHKGLVYTIDIVIDVMVVVVIAE
jgi:hypothetical protein